MAVCLRGIISLIRMVGREAELHQQVLGFSVAHNVRTVNIYAHYPIIVSGKQTTYHHCLMRHIYLSRMASNDRWVPFKFTMAVYEHFAPTLLVKLQSAIDEIPTDLDFDPLESGSDSSPDSGSSGQVKKRSSGPSKPSKPSQPSKPVKQSSPDPARGTGAERASSDFVPDDADAASSPDEGSQASSSSSSSAPPPRKRKKMTKKAIKKMAKRGQKSKA
ncbi:hypothetical protein BJY00DRAFT_29687 [Aspergillus carlsbadensis]|nr:hypothetical protein BJY00DRAFT_29687 [Aspergillus carlsbadensis]